MKMETKNYLVSFFISLFLLVVHFQLIQCSVTYDRKTIIINGQRKILISGSIHYPRSTPDVLLLFFFFILCFFLLIFFICWNVLFVCVLCLIWVCRCGKVSYRRLKMEDWMLFRPMFSGMFMSLLLAMYPSSSSSSSPFSYSWVFLLLFFSL